MEGESWRKLPSVTTFCRGERKRAAPLQGRPYGQTNEEELLNAVGNDKDKLLAGEK